MKKKFLLLFLFTCTFSFSQTQEENQLAEQVATIIYKLSHNSSKSNIYKQIVNETVTINSSSNARFNGGKTRAGFKINLPLGTQMWYYRITLLEPNSYYSYPSNSDFYSMISNKQPFLVNNQTNYGVDFYIMDDNSINNFLQTGNENFRYYSNYSKTNTRGFIGSCDLKFNNLWIGIKNPDLSHGLKAIVEVVAIGNFN